MKVVSALQWLASPLDCTTWQGFDNDWEGKRKLTDDWGFQSRFILDGPILIDHHLSKPTLFRNILKRKIELYKTFLPVCYSEVGNYKYHLFHCLICVQSTIKLNRNMMMKQKTGKRSRKDDHTWIFTAWLGSFVTFVLIGTATLLWTAESSRAQS